MADYSVREKTVTTVEVVVPLPTNGREVALAFSVACLKYKEAHGRETADDSITVTSDGEELVFSFIKNGG